MPDDPIDPGSERFLVENLPPQRAANGPCPGPGLLAAYAEGRLLDEERALVENHAAECESCRALVAAVVREAPGAMVSSRQRWRWYAAAGVAAAALVAIMSGGRGGRQPAHGDTESRLVGASAELAKRHSDLFASFAPLTREERLRRRSVERGALVALQPAGVEIDTRPGLRWEPSPGADEYVVCLTGEDGATLWQVKTSEARLDYPTDKAELSAGRRYAWEVSCTGGPLGDDSAQGAFTVASEVQRASFERAMRLIDAGVPGEISELLKAHFAIRGGFYREAERAARAFFEAHPRDAVARETLFQALELLGSREAEHLLAGGG